ncbi:MAG TPA: winged helix-turn-helix domain-containing protein [Bryobacteraceae bacterium]
MAVYPPGHALGVPTGQALYEDEHLAVDFRQKQVLLDGKTILLRKKEYELLAMLVEAAGRVVTRGTLLERIWGYSTQVRTRTLDVHIRRLRIKLGPDAERYIETIFGVGYRFQPIGLRRAPHEGADSRMAAAL